jgi:hypothetical protein
MSEQNFPDREQAKAALLARNQRAYEALVDLLRPLDDVQLSRPDAAGWAIKDHLGHLAAWQNGITALLQRRPREAAMGLGADAHDGKNEDEINDLIYRANVHLTAAQMMEKLHEAHRQMAAQIESMDNEDLFRPYADFLPVGEDGSDRPVLGWIAGNAYQHYEEHLGWIQERLAE